ncbi:IS110 family transposase [Nocardia sp. GAS34]|uniref:IS110 family transposase n=1 Tax=unclassified Nocardia TaxID=2637762 RepID=UPI003D1EE904
MVRGSGAHRPVVCRGRGTGEQVVRQQRQRRTCQRVVYVPGATVNLAATTYRGAGKTDARDAYLMADQARLRRELTPVRVRDELIAELRMLVARREDLVSNRTRAVNRLRDQILAIGPALERVLDLGTKGPLVLLTGFPTPAVLREAATAVITEWLREQGVYSAERLADKAGPSSFQDQNTCNMMNYQPPLRIPNGSITNCVPDRFFMCRRHQRVQERVLEPAFFLVVGSVRSQARIDHALSTGCA